MTSFICEILEDMKQMNLQNRKRLTDLENKLMVARGEGRREGIVREFGMDMYTLLYLKWITNEDLLYSPGMLHGSMDGKGIWRRMDTCIHMAGSLCCSPETITTLLIGSVCVCVCVLECMRAHMLSHV